MKTRRQTARFIEKPLHWEHAVTLNKEGKGHYGLQELRELLDFVYEGQPRDGHEKLKNPERG